MNRITRDQWGIQLAYVTSLRGTCARRKVGCVLMDSNGLVLSTGYNGVCRGAAHCIETPCPGANLPSGEGLDKCEAIHAEQNALLQCSNVRRIHTCYVTTSPCIHCVKLLLNTSCQRIVAATPYPHGEAVNMWMRDGRELIYLGVEK